MTNGGMQMRAQPSHLTHLTHRVLKMLSLMPPALASPQVTSLFLHLVPACVSWCARWHTDTHHFGPDVYAAQPAPGFRQLVLTPCGFYVVWAVSALLCSVA